MQLECFKYLFSKMSVVDSEQGGASPQSENVDKFVATETEEDDEIEIFCEICLEVATQQCASCQKVFYCTCSLCGLFLRWRSDLVSFCFVLPFTFTTSPLMSPLIPSGIPWNSNLITFPFFLISITAYRL